jgi:hypothetical protein
MVGSSGGRGVVHGTGVCWSNAFQMSVGVAVISDGVGVIVALVLVDWQATITRLKTKLR